MRWVFGKREFSLTSPLNLTYKLPTFLGVWMRFALHDAFRRKPGVIALVGTKAPLSLALAPRNDPLPEVLYL